MLDTWDAAVVARFDALRSPRPAQSVACALTITGDCLAALDQTLNEIRRRAQHRSSDAVARGSELTALRSAAVEVAAGAYAEGLRRRRRHGARANVGASGAVDPSAQANAGLDREVEAWRQGEREPVACLLSPRLSAELDEVLTEALVAGAAGSNAIEELRSMVVEAAIAAWLLLRGYPAVAPPEGRRGGWLDSVRHLVARRRRGRP